jgi:hypothetical protein
VLLFYTSFSFELPLNIKWIYIYAQIKYKEINAYKTKGENCQMLPKCCQAKEKLLALGLSETIVDEVLGVYANYRLALGRYKKPAGPVTFKNDLAEIEAMSKKLSGALKRLSHFERQVLLRCGAGDVGKTALQVASLSSVCGHAKGKDVSRYFNKKEPFLRQLAIEVKEILESHDIRITVYEKNVFCLILDILLNQQAATKSLSLLRQILKTS